MRQLGYTRLDQQADTLRIWLRAWRRWLFPLVGGFLLGTFTNLMTDSSATSLPNLLAVLKQRSLLMICVLIVVAFALAVWVLGALLEAYCRRRSFDVLFSDLVASRVDPVATPFAKGRLAWGPAITLQLAPDLREGWTPDAIETRYDGKVFSMNPEYMNAYRRYFDDNFERLRFFDA